MSAWFKSGLVVVFRTLLAVALVFTQMPLTAQAQAGSVGAGRLALVIGNSNYQHIPTLKNPERDAALISSTLRDLGFDVIEKTDLDRDGFEAAVSEALAKAPDTSAVLFYFAGHGFQLGGRNYLVPTDATLTDRARISEETLSLDSLIGQLQSRDRQTLLLLDACRNNPLPRASRDNAFNDGLAQIETGSGTFVAFATQPGNITNDGAGANSPFSLALAEHMPTEGISISDMMIRVRNTVEETTLQKQTPWDQSSLRSQFYFNALEEDSDALTDEDLELLAQLDPELLEKFKKRFGLNFEEADDGEPQSEMVATVVPALRIEAASEPIPEMVNAELSLTPAVDLEAETTVRAMPDVPAENAPQGPTDIALLDMPAAKPGLLITPGLVISGGGAQPQPAPPAAGSDPAGDAIAPAPVPAASAGVSGDDAEIVADPAGDGLNFTIPLPQQRPDPAPEPDIEIALAAPEIVLSTAPPAVPAPAVATPQIPVPEARPTGRLQLAPPDVISDDPVTEPGAPREEATAEDPAAADGALPSPEPAPRPTMMIVAPEPLPSTVPPELAPVDVAALMPEFTPPSQLSAAPVIAAIAPDPVPERKVQAGADKPVAAPLPDIKATLAQPEGAAPVLTPTATPAPTPASPAAEAVVELAALDPATSGPGALEMVPESPLPEPAPVVDLEELRKSLAMKAQTELQRLGCYRSAIDGDWGPKSARALLRYYAEQKLTPDETDPSEALISMLSAETTVVCKTTVKAKPTVSKKSTATAPAAKTTRKVSKPVAKRSSPPKKAVAAKAPASKSKKLKSGSMIGAFR
ncbi:caspase family protein [Hoeflea ulvae]|uniref:Caspase family protein n=1 Tax=Hoeflea ulvae TaxID=2983764 RepID=A0ABT3YGZ7_9HYPH|nr:caspase family protein [Hoeflea ulvae]MCY0095171.1 caspase family protein [Hoeflea ulvae]